MEQKKFCQIQLQKEIFNYKPKRGFGRFSIHIRPHHVIVAPAIQYIAYFTGILFEN